MKAGSACAWLMVLLIGSASLSAQDMKSTERKLRELKGELADIASEQRKLESQRGDAARALRAADEAVGKSARTLAQTQAAIARQQSQLGALQAQHTQLQGALAGQRAELARLVRSMYMAGNEGPLKLLLAQDRVAVGQRNLAYYGALQRERVARAHALAGQLHALDAVELAIAEKHRTLGAAKASQQQALVALQQDRSSRSTLVAQLDDKYQDSTARAQAVGRDAKALERLLAQLRAAAARAERERRLAAERAERARKAEEAAARRAAAAASRNVPAGKDTAASETRPSPPQPRPAVTANIPSVRVGGAGWPVNGGLLAGFGATMPDGSRSSGYLLGAPMGTQVRAVAAGTVVFAEWMSGYGLISIIDHGNGYMSLYAHNDALLRDVGAQVQRGEVVGSVGNSGGQGQPALYFELRRNGQPVDPAVWLRR